MNHDVVLIITISLIVVFSPFVAKLLKIPTTPIEIVLGSAFGYFGFISANHYFDVVAEVGFLFLMFLAGMEINLKSITNTSAEQLKKILAYIALLYAFSISVSLYFNLGKVFMVLLPLISIGLVATLVKEYGKLPWLALSMTAGAIGEIISIAVLTLTSSGLKYGVGYEFAVTIISLILFILFIISLFKVLELMFWWFPEVATALMPHNDNKEQDIRLSMGIFFILLSAMLYLHLDLAFGAFIAGIFIPTFFKHKSDLPEKLESFGFGFLVPLFFIHIGASFDLQALLMDSLIEFAFVIAIAMITMRVISSFVFVKELGVIDTILMGLSHSMPLTLLIAMATLAYSSNSIDKLHYYAFILASLIEVIAVMISIKIFHNIKTKQKKVQEA
jgi:Kef-type K+ transport system membrane component KefB